jgi:hypothetical protein
MTNEQITAQLNKITNKIAETALTMRSCNLIVEFDFHAERLEKQVRKLRTLSTQISGGGTGKN